MFCNHDIRWDLVNNTVGFASLYNTNSMSHYLTFINRKFAGANKHEAKINEAKFNSV